MKKKLLVTLLASSMVLSMLAGCGASTEAPAATDSTETTTETATEADAPAASAEGGKVYYLNFKPEADEYWQKIAATYTEQTGVPVTVVTAAEGTYEETLTAEIDKTEAPTLFQISGAVGYESWKDYCLDLSGSKVYGELTSDDFAIKNDNGVFGIAYVYEGYGIVANKSLLEKAGYSIDDVKDFASLKSISEDIASKKDELGFTAFTSAGLDSSSSWRFSGHLANIPLFYEFEADGITSQPAAIKGTYLDNFKGIWDVYTQYATCAPADLTSKTGDDSVAEFVNGEAVFYQNGTWCYNDIKSIGDENIGYLPIYIGVRDEKEGLSCGTENYWAVNSLASAEDQQATLDFLYWMVTSEEGTTALASDMGFVSPFKSAKSVDNVLCNIMNEYVADGCYNVSWAFNFTPNTESWRAPVVSALAAYSAGTGSWDDVVTAYVDGWAEQYELSQQ